LVEVGNGDGDVIQFSDHSVPRHEAGGRRSKGRRMRPNVICSTARISSANPVEPLFDRGEPRVDHGFELGVGENVRPVVFDPFTHELADIGWIDAVRDALLNVFEHVGRRIAASLSSEGRSKRSGRLRTESMILVRMNPGHSTDTPIPRWASSPRNPSERATTPYFDTL